MEIITLHKSDVGGYWRKDSKGKNTLAKAIRINITKPNRYGMMLGMMKISRNY